MHSGCDSICQTAHNRKARPNTSTERNLDTVPSLVIESMVDINFWERQRETILSKGAPTDKLTDYSLVEDHTFKNRYETVTVLEEILKK